VKNYWITKWCKKLGIKEKIRAEFVLKEQIECDYKINYRLVCIDIKGATIYHDRRLREPDIIHELCHYRWPHRKETWIRNKTKELYESQKSKQRTQAA
jgi:hypothetical protein